jgi:hypothetical protein
VENRDVVETTICSSPLLTPRAAKRVSFCLVGGSSEQLSVEAAAILAAALFREAIRSEPCCIPASCSLEFPRDALPDRSAGWRIGAKQRLADSAVAVV